ncbi:MAG: class I SAM-dependent methyltransferase [Candidatus Absconditabacteria bacterium]
MANALMIGYMVLGVFKKTTQAPYISSFTKDILVMKKKLHLKHGSSLIDLGCGDGKAMRFFVNTYGLKCVGFDINFYAIVIGKILTYFSPQRKNIQFFMKNFFKADLSKFDYIYVYLLPVQLKAIESRVWKYKKKETIIVSNTFQFTEHTPFEIIENEKGKKVIFLYK